MDDRRESLPCIHNSGELRFTFHASRLRLFLFSPNKNCCRIGTLIIFLDRGGTMTIGVALIGCGKIGQGHADGYKAAADLAEMVLYCDEWNEAQARELAAGSSADVSTNWQEVIERDDVDAVDICMPHYLHEPIALAAAKAGKHILVENPMALNIKQARA